jgi:acetyl esterase
MAMKRLLTFTLILGALITMTQSTAAPNAADDSRIDPLIRSFLAEVDKDNSPFWTLPGSQVRAVLTGLHSKTPVDVSGVTIAEKTISENGQSVQLYIMKSEKVVGTPPVLLLIHGGVWIASDFEKGPTQ